MDVVVATTIVRAMTPGELELLKDSCIRFDDSGVPAVGETHRRDMDVLVEALEDTAEGLHRSRFTFMTGDLARDGMIIRPDGGSVDSFNKNPVVLWAHGFDSQRGQLPIGRASNVKQDGDKWTADVEYVADSFSGTIADMVRDAFLNAVSIGWRTLAAGWEKIDGVDVYVIREWELTEFSIVAVPSDPGALVTQRDAELAALRADNLLLLGRIQTLEEGALADTSTAVGVQEGTDAPLTSDAEPEPIIAATRVATPEETYAYLASLIPGLEASFERAMGRA